MTMSLNGLRIGLLTASASRLGGGVFQAVTAQAAMIRASGGEAAIFALRDRHAEADATQFAPNPVRHAPVLGPAMLGFAPRLLDMLLNAELDCLHLHGIWMYPSRAGSRWAARTGRPYLISPHGMLAPWILARGRAKKLGARLGYERASWRAADALHALSLSEAGDIERETGRPDAVVIPNAAPAARAPAEQAPAANVLYIGRIHPKKNLAALLTAWERCARVIAATGARLVIAGWGAERHLAELRELLARAPASVHFVGSVFGADKDRLLSEARFVVLPSHSEGLPMAVLEAWSAAVPTIMSHACNLEAGFAAGAAIDCGTSPSEIAAGLEKAILLDDEQWLAMSASAQRLARGPFAPSTVSQHWVSTYRALILRERLGTAW